MTSTQSRTVVPRRTLITFDGVPETCPTCRSIQIVVDADGSDEWYCRSCHDDSAAYRARVAAAGAPPPSAADRYDQEGDAGALSERYAAAEERAAEMSGSAETGAGPTTSAPPPEAAVGTTGSAHPPLDDEARRRELQTSGRPRKWTDSEMLSYLRAWSSANDAATPTIAQWNTSRPHDAPKSKAYEHRFGGWRNAITEAGLPQNPPKLPPKRSSPPPPPPSAPEPAAAAETPAALPAPPAGPPVRAGGEETPTADVLAAAEDDAGDGVVVEAPPAEPVHEPVAATISVRPGALGLMADGLLAGATREHTVRYVPYSQDEDPLDHLRRRYIEHVLDTVASYEITAAGDHFLFERLCDRAERLLGMQPGEAA